ncbi:MAG: CCA tRNA nucleotidyltransferase [Methanosarcinaceae archaeon]|nr:CCA tRNA nucleotidyltransferase [Methanosarcinaceae archaeon]MDD4332470.1 CCA tRNA nucleotidyltransferase [Methanosarcinaceae archaeon]MDD4748999.1 CCA tRNA nucleotidyltransferase [Methanosarcinaceae archaeon]
MKNETTIPEELKKRVLEKIRPDASERTRLLAVQVELAEKVNRAAETLGIKAVFAKMVGSAARGTWLSGTHDIDIFISFPEETSRADLEKKGMAVAREVAKTASRIEDRHAEHPYLNIIYKGFDIDLVPCFRVASTSSLKSAVDRTPFHNEFVKKRIKGLEAEVLLLKQFMRGSGVYGSELKTRGFSGYLTELLVINYGSFENTLKAAASWSPGEFIDLEAHASLSHPDPLVMVDPTDPKRNVAAALSLDKFCLFMASCRAFLKDPTFEAFFPVPVKPLTEAEISEKIKARQSAQLALSFKTPDVVEDVLFPQLYKSEQAAVTLLEEYEFSHLKSGVWAGKTKTIILLELISNKLPKVKKHIGPPVWLSSNAEKFRAKYEKKEDVFSFYIEKGRYVAEIKRKYPEAATLLKAKFPDCPLGKHIGKSVRQGFEVLENEELLRLEDPGFRIFLKKWL